MKTRCTLLFIAVLGIACQGNPQFIPSRVYKDVVFLKNPPKNDSVCRQLIIDELLTRRKGQPTTIYLYTFYSSHFIENEEDDGGPTSMYFLSECELLCFSYDEVCKNDTTQHVKVIRFENPSLADTLIGKCP